MIKHIIIHHTGISRTKAKYQFYPVNQYHKDKWNFRSELGFYGGYQYIIEANGLKYQYRRDTEEGAHCIGHNTDSIGICLAGNFDIEMPTSKQMDILKDILKDKMAIHGLSQKDIRLHRDMQNYRTCPGRFITDNFISDVLKEPEVATDDLEKKKLIAQKITLLNKIVSLLLALFKRKTI